MGIKIKEIFSKTILTEVKGALDVGFTHSLNPYSGCAFSCKYCYVREMPIQKFKEVPWGEWINIKANAAEIYKKEVLKFRKQDNPINIFMSSATDPYQPIERKVKITRMLLEEMIKNPPDLLQIQTRGPLITRDIDLLTQLQKQCKVIISVTIETDREDVKQIFSPYAPGIKLRLKTLRTLHDTGLLTQASISPVLPFTPDFPKKLNGIVDHIWIDTLILGDGSFGRRSKRLGMPHLFKQHGLEKWYLKDLHVRVYKYFSEYFNSEIIRVSKEKGFLAIKD